MLNFSHLGQIQYDLPSLEARRLKLKTLVELMNELSKNTLIK